MYLIYLYFNCVCLKFYQFDGHKVGLAGYYRGLRPVTDFRHPEKREP